MFFAKVTSARRHYMQQSCRRPRHRHIPEKLEGADGLGGGSAWRAGVANPFLMVVGTMRRLFLIRPGIGFLLYKFRHGGVFPLNRRTYDNAWVPAVRRQGGRAGLE
jgi:hypothetical protein